MGGVEAGRTISIFDDGGACIVSRPTGGSGDSDLRDFDVWHGLRAGQERGLAKSGGGAGRGWTRGIRKLELREKPITRRRPGVFSAQRNGGLVSNDRRRNARVAERIRQAPR